jgi:hypothetical protein
VLLAQQQQVRTCYHPQHQLSQVGHHLLLELLLLLLCIQQQQAAPHCHHQRSWCRRHRAHPQQ